MFVKTKHMRKTILAALILLSFSSTAQENYIKYDSAFKMEYVLVKPKQILGNMPVINRVYRFKGKDSCTFLYCHYRIDTLPGKPPTFEVIRFMQSTRTITINDLKTKIESEITSWEVMQSFYLNTPTLEIIE